MKDTEKQEYTSQRNSLKNKNFAANAFRSIPIMPMGFETMLCDYCHRRDSLFIWCFNVTSVRQLGLAHETNEVGDHSVEFGV